MKINRRYKPEAAAGTNLSRPALTVAHLDVEAKAVYATDSYLMLKAPVTVAKEDESGPIPLDAFRKARELSSGEILCANGTAEVPKYAMFPRPTVGKLPEWEKIMPTSEPVVCVGFDIDILKRAAEALGSSCVELRFFNEKPGPITEQPIVMIPLPGDRVDDEACVVVMPIRLAKERP